MAPDLGPKRLIRLIDDFRVDRRFTAEVTPEELARVAERFPRQAAPLRRALAELQDEPTRSTWEQEWPPYAEFYDLPPYEMNVPVLTHRQFHRHPKVQADRITTILARSRRAA